MKETSVNALEIVAERGTRLQTQWCLDWPETVQQAVCRLRLEPAADHLPSLAAIVGGASSGKSTVFNNLLDGHLVSRITARGHVTLGPILAVHEQHRPVVERLLAEGKLLPGIHRVSIDLDGNATGEPDAVAVSFHTIDSLREVLLFDLPDFTSEHARQEGDIALRLLPWFDRIVVVVDDRILLYRPLQPGVGCVLHAPAFGVMDDRQPISEGWPICVDHALDDLPVPAVVHEVEPPSCMGLRQHAGQRAGQQHWPVLGAHDHRHALTRRLDRAPPPA